MDKFYRLTFGILILTIALGTGYSIQTEINDSPTIGVLTQATDPPERHLGQEFLMSEYAKYLEMAGASVVAVKGAQPKKYYHDLFHKINGVLFPGGHVGFDNSTYAVSARYMFDLAKAANEAGDYFPLWGTCQGFQTLAFLVAGKNCLSPVDAEDMTIPLNLTGGYKVSRLLGDADDALITILSTQNVTANLHKLSLSIDTYRKLVPVKHFFRVLSTNKDRGGKRFVSTMEAYKYPFYGTQWHPEKNIFTRNPQKVLSHTVQARRVTQYMANFFVDEARKNLHRFKSNDERSRTVIENDVRVYTPHGYIENFYYNVTAKAIDE